MRTEAMKYDVTICGFVIKLYKRKYSDKTMANTFA